VKTQNSETNQASLKRLPTILRSI